MQHLQFIDFPSTQHVSGNFLPIFRSARPYYTACGFLHPILLPGCGLESRGDGPAPSTPNTQTAPRLSGPQRGKKIGCRKPQAVKYGLVLLKMCKILPETCWADGISINYSCCIYLISHIISQVKYVTQNEPKILPALGQQRVTLWQGHNQLPKIWVHKRNLSNRGN
jgi:hypothetical protein